VRQSLGNLQGALSDCNIAIDLDKNSAESYYQRGLIKYLSGKKKDAITDLDIALKIDNQLGEVYARRGITRYELGYKKEVLADLNAALKLESQLSPNILLGTYTFRSLVKADLGDVNGAAADFMSVLKAVDLVSASTLEAAKFSPSMIHSQICKEKNDSGDYKGAVINCNVSIIVKPNDADAYSYRGDSKYSLGDKQGALRDYDTAIRFNPQFVDAYNSRGFLKYSLGDKQGALRDYDDAIRINTKHASAYGNAAFVKYDLGDVLGAIDYWRKSLKLQPDEPDIQLGLAVALYKQGQIAEANQLGIAAPLI
jgi:tetratricopeptide (TPR) repeat protein